MSRGNRTAALSGTHWAAQLARFLIVGVLNTLVGVGTIWALIGLAGWRDIPANFAGYVVGLICSFILNRRWTFRHRGPWLASAVRFFLVFATAYGANLFAMLLLRDYLAIDRYLAHALATIPYTMIFFVGSRVFAFRSRHAHSQIDIRTSGP